MLAIAIVLLPDSKVMNLCLKLNQEAWKEGRASLRLGKEIVPHIGLVVGCVKENHLGEIKKKLKNLKSKPVKTALVEMTHFNDQKPGSPDNKACLKVKKTQGLAALQKAVAKATVSFFSYNATSEMFFKERGKEISFSTIRDVNQYMEKRGGENYNPHISLKCWGFPNKKLNLPSTRPPTTGDRFAQHRWHARSLRSLGAAAIDEKSTA